MTNILIVFLGAGLGGAIRLVISQNFPKPVYGDFPLATMVINILGSLVMGLLVGYFTAKGNPPQWVRLFLTTGVLGGFTTFSTFSLEAALLCERGTWLAAELYVAGSVGLGLLALFGGLALARTAA